MQKKAKTKKFLSADEFCRKYKNALRYLRAQGASKEFLDICKRLQKESGHSFPEVTLRQASALVGCRPQAILTALNTWKLPGRAVLGDDFIQLVDLWHFRERWRKRWRTRNNKNKRHPG